MTWKKKCRCGAPLNFSCEDIESGRPAEGADYWCSGPVAERGPHDWGVVCYQPVLKAISPSAAWNWHSTEVG